MGTKKYYTCYNCNSICNLTFLGFINSKIVIKDQACIGTKEKENKVKTGGAMKTSKMFPSGYFYQEKKLKEKFLSHLQ
jgi:hypothetical protein